MKALIVALTLRSTIALPRFTMPPGSTVKATIWFCGQAEERFNGDEGLDRGCRGGGGQAMMAVPSYELLTV